MKLHWYGHSCFLIKSSAGRNLLFDPFNEKVGYDMPEYRADVVLTSHSHYDHAYVSGVKGKFKLINNVGTYQEAGFNIRGISTFHDDQNGSIRGNNIVFCVESDGVKVCHLGDIGHLLSKQQCEEIGIPEVLLLPVGGGYTVSVEKAEMIRRQLNPACTILTHFKTAVCKLGIAPLEEYLAVAPKEKIAYLGNNLDCKEISEKHEIVVMEYGV